MSLLVSRQFVLAQLRVGLLSCEDQPSERIISLPRPFGTRRSSSSTANDGKEVYAQLPPSPPIVLPAIYDRRARPDDGQLASGFRSIQPSTRRLSLRALPHRDARETSLTEKAVNDQAVDDNSNIDKDNTNVSMTRSFRMDHEDLDAVEEGYQDDTNVERSKENNQRRQLDKRKQQLRTNLPPISSSDDELGKNPVSPTSVAGQQPNDKASGESLSLSISRASQPPKVEPLRFEKAMVSTENKVVVSVLSSMFHSPQPNENPFAQSYSRVTGQGELQPLSLNIHFAFLPDSSSTTMAITVVHDAIVEQVIGYALFLYIEQELLPELQSAQYAITNWQMRIVEDDGTVDNDFPALDRNRQIHQFQFDQFALCEIVKGGIGEYVNGQLTSIPEIGQRSVSFATTLRDEGRSSTMGRDADSEQGDTNHSRSNLVPAEQQQILRPKFFIKVHLYSTIEIRHSTTLNVSTTTSLRDIFDAVCKKRSVNPRDYVLKLSNMKTEVAHDKTVGELNGETELFLVKRTFGASAGDLFLRPPGEEPPRAPPVPMYSLSKSDFSTATAYRKYTVVRKLPMLVGRHERVLTIDGEYIHLLPPENRHFFDTIKTSSYHITSVVSCKQNKKLPTNFRLLVNKDTREAKSYDFEASSPSEAAEICSKINMLIQLNN